MAAGRSGGAGPEAPCGAEPLSHEARKKRGANVDFGGVARKFGFLGGGGDSQIGMVCSEMSGQWPRLQALPVLRQTQVVPCQAKSGSLQQYMNLNPKMTFLVAGNAEIEM